MSLSVTRNSPVAVDIESWAPGFAIRGVIIDNPSGMWLQLQPGGLYVPPFTFGWRTALNGVLQISVNAVAGPGALTSQAIGQPITVTLTEERTDNWNGYTTLGPGAITADLIAAGVVIVGTINEVTNDGATVVIDINGITITDGFLILQDEFGRTVLEGSGFSGSWADFIKLGLYNARYLAGTDGVVPLGRTSALPYWTVANVAGAPTLTYDSTPTPDGPVQFTFAAINTTKQLLSDGVPLADNGETGITFGVVFYISRAAGSVRVRVYYEVADDLSFASVTQSVQADYTQAVNTTDALTFLTGTDTISGRYGRLVIEVSELVGHSASNNVKLVNASMVESPSTIPYISVESSGTQEFSVNPGIDPSVRVHNNLQVDGYIVADNAYPDVQVFTASGTWNKPAGVHHIVVEVVGGGGAGGSCQATAGNESSAAGGGGGGGYARKLFNATDLINDSTYTVTRGAGGAAAAAGNNDGNAGGASSFAGTGITTVQGNGGAGGNGATATTGPERNLGGDGGSATGGDINQTGSDGHFGVVVRGDGGQGDPGSIGNGGASAFGGGGGRGSAASGNGAAGNPYGGGGAGGWNANSQASGRTGGAGSNGVVIVTTYFAP